MAELAPAPLALVEEDAARVRRRRSPFVYACLAWLGIVVVLALFGTLLAPRDPNGQDIVLGLSGPVSGHPLGTDELGRDVLSRLMAGARTAVVGPLLVALAAALLSTLAGLVAGYRGGWAETGVMRLVDLLLALPPLLILVVIAGIFGGGYWLAIGVLAILFAPGDTRIVRGATLEQKSRAYVEAAQVMGLRSWRVMRSHLLPNIAPLVIVDLGLDFTYALVALSGLSFLGLGVPPGNPDWGRTLSENRDLLFQNPWSALAPAVMIICTAASANVVGDWLYERLAARGRSR